MNTLITEALGVAGSRWSAIHANDRTTHYVKRGRGPTLLLLVRNDRELGNWPTIAAHLSAAHRVIVPDFDAPAGELGVWLNGFLDGIGIASTTMIAAHDLCLPALQVVLRGCERISGLILVSEPLVHDDVVKRHLPMEPNLQGEMNNQPLVLEAQHARIPMLLLDDDAPISEIIGSLDWFLRFHHGG